MVATLVHRYRHVFASFFLRHMIQAWEKTTSKPSLLLEYIELSKNNIGGTQASERCSAPRLGRLLSINQGLTHSLP